MPQATPAVPAARWRGAGGRDAPGGHGGPAAGFRGGGRVGGRNFSPWGSVCSGVVRLCGHRLRGGGKARWTARLGGLRRLPCAERGRFESVVTDHAGLLSADLTGTQTAPGRAREPADLGTPLLQGTGPTGTALVALVPTAQLSCRPHKRHVARRGGRCAKLAAFRRAVSAHRKTLTVIHVRDEAMVLRR